MPAKKYSEYDYFAAALKLKKKLAAARGDPVQMVRILKEIIYNEKIGLLRDMARNRLTSLTERDST